MFLCNYKLYASDETQPLIDNRLSASIKPSRVQYRWTHPRLVNNILYILIPHKTNNLNSDVRSSLQIKSRAQIVVKLDLTVQYSSQFPGTLESPKHRTRTWSATQSPGSTWSHRHRCQSLFHPDEPPIDLPAFAKIVGRLGWNFAGSSCWTPDSAPSDGSSKCHLWPNKKGIN